MAKAPGMAPEWFVINASKAPSVCWVVNDCVWQRSHPTQLLCCCQQPMGPQLLPKL